MATLRELKGRIGSVASSEKITGAMKMISSAKMHKAELAIRRLRPYRDCIRHIIANLLSADAPVQSPLTADRPVASVAIVVLGSDDGLCGAYNVNIYKGLLDHIADMRSKWGEGVDITVLTIGRKIAKVAARLDDGTNTHVVTPDDAGPKSEGEQVRAFMEQLQSDFVSGKYDRIDMVYMNFISAGRQRLRIEQLLPLQPQALTDGAAVASSRPYIFEPDAASIYDRALPMYMLASMQNVFAENRASEQAARVMAMQSSNDNAKKLLEQLRLEYNKLRQQGITNELLDIVGGQTRD